MDTSKALNKVLEVKVWTQADLARACGWDPSYVSQLATGHRDAGAETTRKIADATGVPPFLFALLGADPDDLRPGINPDVAEELANDLLELVVARNEEGRQVSPARIEALTWRDVARWAAMADAATAGPWEAMQTPPPSRSDHGWRAVATIGTWMVGCARDVFLHVHDNKVRRKPEHNEADVTFIAAARTAVPALCAEVARLRAALVDARAWRSLSDEQRAHVLAGVRAVVPLQCESDRATIHAWDAALRALGYVGGLAQQIAARGIEAHRRAQTDVPATNAEERETSGYVAALLTLSAWTCITGRPEDAARAFGGLLGAAGESEDGRCGAARALRDVAAVLDGQPVPETTAEQDALRREAERAKERANGANPVLHSQTIDWWDGRARGAAVSES